MTVGEKAELLNVQLARAEEILRARFSNLPLVEILIPDGSAMAVLGWGTFGDGRGLFVRRGSHPHGEALSRMPLHLRVETARLMPQLFRALEQEVSGFNSRVREAAADLDCFLTEIERAHEPSER
jgi:hypothetical protein